MPIDCDYATRPMKLQISQFTLLCQSFAEGPAHRVTGRMTVIALAAGLLMACQVTVENTPTATSTAYEITATAVASTVTRTPRSTRTPLPTPVEPPTPSPTPGPLAWRALGPGVSVVELDAPHPAEERRSPLIAFRLHPEHVDFAVYYGVPQPVSAWQEDLNAPIVFNASFFNGEGVPLGRLVIDGELYGGPLSRVYGPDSVSIPGMFTVIDGEVGIYATGRADHVRRDLAFDQVVETYPLLLLPGGQPNFAEETESRARRTVIGIDEEGYVIVMLIPHDGFSLHELANWLAVSPLRLDTALNLDGGRSSGLIVVQEGFRWAFDSAVDVPVVIAVTPR